LLGVLACLLLVSDTASAQVAPRPPPRYRLAVDLPLTLGALGAWLGSELAKSRLAPEHCRWCSADSFDRRAREALVWHDTGAARHTSNAVAAGVLPLGIAGVLAWAAWRDGAIDRLPDDLGFVAEAVALSGLTNQLVKFGAGRERPFVHVLPNDQKRHTAQPADNNLSFYSSHTSMAFAMAVAAGTCASLRGYRGAPYVWATGLALALLSGYLRVAADKHYTSDVLVGAATGSAFGALVPWLHARWSRRRWASAAVRTRPARSRRRDPSRRRLVLVWAGH
jgi:membrane-associated phospholipid phosphatase